MNSVCLIGNIGGEIEARYLDSGKVIASFSIAVSRGKDKPPDWFAITAFDKTAEVVINYCKKGSKVGVNGRIQQEKWVDQSGANRSTVKVIASQVDLLSTKQEADLSAGDDETAF